MKYKKLLILLPIIILGVFLIYKFFANPKMIYVALGDSLAQGMNPYGEIGYSYTDYLAEALEKQNLLESFSKEYTQSGHETYDVIEEIHLNAQIKKDLRESDLVTVSIGANDFLNRTNQNGLSIEAIKNMKSIAIEIFPDIDDCIKEIRKYAKEDLIIVGYYNPIPFLFNTSQKELDELFAYIDDEYRKIAEKYDAQYVSNYELFKANQDFLPNPMDIHPNTKGYEAIANQILESYLNKEK